MGAAAILGDVVILMQDIKKGGATMVTFVGGLKRVFDHLTPVLRYCGVMKDGVVAGFGVLNGCCKTPADFVKHIEANLKVDDVFIMRELGGDVFAIWEGRLPTWDANRYERRIEEQIFRLLMAGGFDWFCCDYFNCC